jgi:hypothetical protein
MSVITKKITLRFPMFDRCYGDHILITEEFSKVCFEVNYSKEYLNIYHIFAFRCLVHKF